MSAGLELVVDEVTGRMVVAPLSMPSDYDPRRERRPFFASSRLAQRSPEAAME
jgi:hypothetical protein